MKIKKHTKTKLSIAEYEKLKGSIEAHQYRFDSSKGIYIKNIRKIQGVAAARRKAKKFYLATNAGNTGRMYLTDDGKLSYVRGAAKVFYEGFDDPKTRVEHWQKITNVKLFDVH